MCTLDNAKILCAHRTAVSSNVHIGRRLFQCAHWTIPHIGLNNTYVAHTDKLPNPERGIYLMTHYSTSMTWSPLIQNAYVQGIQNWAVGFVMMEVIFDAFLNATLTPEVLTNIDAEFNRVRGLGLKVVLRLVYSIVAPCGSVCEPALNLILTHLQQLAPVCHANMDVISIVQAGLIGAWGEWAYTTNFGSNVYTGQLAADRKTVVEAVLSLFPNRTVQIRTPAWIKTMYGNTPLSAPEPSTSLGRIGYHDDCFLNTINDRGTYQQSNPTQNPESTADYAFIAQQSTFTGSIFEPCLNSTRADCATALKEVRDLHMASASFNGGYLGIASSVWFSWTASGCFDEIVNGVGYRMAMRNSQVDSVAQAGGVFKVSVSMSNIGFAAPVNVRLVEFVLRKVSDNSICTAPVNTDTRQWYAASNITIQVNIGLPASMTTGEWEVLIAISDPYPRLYGVPWYRTLLSNRGAINEGTGFNKLLATVNVIPSSLTSSAPFSVTSTAICGLTLSSIVNSTVQTMPEGGCRTGYYLVSASSSSQICMLCPPGSQCATGQPVMCPSGTYSPGGQNVCTACPLCANGGSCQQNSGVCLCASGFIGFDCSINAATTSIPTVFTSSAPYTTVAPSTAVVTSSLSSVDVGYLVLIPVEFIVGASSVMRLSRSSVL